MAAVRQRKVAEGLGQDTAGLVGNIMPITPSQQFIQHEWAMHDTCSGLSVQDYFGSIEKLYNGLEVPPESKKPTSSAQTTDVAIEISRPENEFSVVEVCLSMELQYQACPNTVKECRAPHIEVKPVP